MQQSLLSFTSVTERLQMQEDRRGLFIVTGLERRLALFLSRHDPGPTVRLHDTEYRAISYDDVTGFYDWLRKADGTITGVRYTPASENESLLLAASQCDSARVRSSPSQIEIFFSGSQSFVPELSDDQAFGGNRVYRSSGGGFAISFDAYGLSEDELRSIRTAVQAFLE